MPLQATSGAASYDGFGGGVPAAKNYIEDVFSTYLYTGNGSTQTITNSIDLAGKGGLVWIKARTAAESHSLYDTSRGANWQLQTNSTAAQQKNDPNSPWFSDYSVTSFNAAGFSLGAYYSVNGSTLPEVSWTFRKQPKFFDVVTYTGNGANTRTISHSLGSVPGCVISKITSTANNWYVYHRGLTSADYALLLNTTAAEQAGSGYTGATPTAPTATEFTVGGNSTNANGATYVAYLFAHNAGGFGLTGTDNVISCGSYAGTGAAGNIVTLGYEPQWLMIKRIDSAQVWTMYDNMRGIVTGGNDPFLIANYSDAETTGTNFISVNATGFSLETLDQQVNSGSGTYIYIAIRRGPMKVPTSGTSVFAPNASLTNTQYTVGFPNDWAIEKRPAGTTNWRAGTRLTGNDAYLDPNSTAAEVANTTWVFNGPTNTFTQLRDATGALVYSFKRAPSYFDVVCYTGTGSARTINHNLGVTPELMIVKTRGTVNNWIVYCSLLNTPAQNRLVLNGNFGQLTTPNATWWNSTNPTSSVFSLSGDTGVNGSGQTQVAYLFATCAGVSKVGSYTGTGTTLQVNCGFTGGARFVLIKRTDSTGSWYVWDVARGISSGNDPYLLLNSTAAEVTSTDYIDAYSAGFEISSTAPAEINASGGSFIFLAIS